MIYNIPDTINNIGFIGDIHGYFKDIVYKIKAFDIKNTCFIFCGDVGLGFYNIDYYKQLFRNISKYLYYSNNIFLFIRGNHDNPLYFNDKTINLKRIKALSDYSIIKAGSQNILIIGGGISIDRFYRKQYDNNNIIKYSKYYKCDIEEAKEKCNRTYWNNENIVYRNKVNYKIDIICSHSSPSFCYPVDKGPIVQKFSLVDDKLLYDLDHERSILDIIYNDYKDTIIEWYYGHFHYSRTDIINNIKFRLLDINEIFCRPIINE